MDELSSITSQVITALITSTGLVGLLGLLLKNWISSALKAANAEKEKQIEYRRREEELLEEYRHAFGRVLFWAVRGMNLYAKDHPQKNYWNGELKESMEKFNKAEDEMKKLKNEQIARLRSKK